MNPDTALNQLTTLKESINKLDDNYKDAIIGYIEDAISDLEFTIKENEPEPHSDFEEHNTLNHRIQGLK